MIFHVKIPKNCPPGLDPGETCLKNVKTFKTNHLGFPMSKIQKNCPPGLEPGEKCLKRSQSLRPQNSDRPPAVRLESRNDETGTAPPNRTAQMKMWAQIPS